MNNESSNSPSLTISQGKIVKSSFAKADSHPLLKRAVSLEKDSPQQSLYYGDIPMPKPVAEWNKSSATLRNSSIMNRFSSNQRFFQPKSQIQNTQNLIYPSSLNKRSTFFGSSQRFNIPSVFSHGKGQASQSCPFYEINTDQKLRSVSSVSLQKGKSFGLGWKYFESARTPHRTTVHSSRQVNVNPSPNQYNLNPEQKYDHNKIKIHQKLAMFTTLNGHYRRNQPSPQTYELKQSLVKPSIRKTSMGFSNKVDFTKIVEVTPGPIYTSPSFCDKFTHLKLKLKK